MGLAKGEGELDPAAHKLAGAGFAVAQIAQVTPEIGDFVTPEPADLRRSFAPSTSAA